MVDDKDYARLSRAVGVAAAARDRARTGLEDAERRLSEAVAALSDAINGKPPRRRQPQDGGGGS